MLGLVEAATVLSSAVATVLATIVDWAALGRTVLASAVAGLSLAFVFSLGILGLARSMEARLEGRTAVALSFGLLAGLGFAASVALAATGIFVMIRG